MEIARAFMLAGLALLSSSCTGAGMDMKRVQDVYVADFQSEDIKTCRPSDVDLGHKEARDFFLRAKQVDRKTLHDHYNRAPCYIEGTLKYGGVSCDWKIRAGATGVIRCQDKESYFACDACQDLFPSATNNHDSKKYLDSD